MMFEAPAYHAHVYFHPEEAEAITAIHTRARQDLEAIATVWPIRDRPVGPHPLPMFEIEFPRQGREAVVAWVERHRGAFTVLLHPETGNDLIDHRDRAVWLGPPVTLDLSRLS